MTPDVLGREGSTAYLGHLFVEPRRHAPGLADLADAEADARATVSTRQPRAIRGSGGLNTSMPRSSATRCRTFTFTCCRVSRALRVNTGLPVWMSGRRRGVGGAAESGRSSGSCAGTWATEHPGSALVRSSVRERRLRAARQFNRSAGSGIDLLSCLGCAHRWGWTIRLNPDGTTTATSPDGMENAAQSQPATGGVTAGRDLLVHVRLLANCRSGSWTSEPFWGVVRAASRP